MTPIRFTVEKRHLADSEGRPVASGEPDSVGFHNINADSVEEAVRLFVNDHQAELIGSVLRFPGYQAVATIRTPTGVYTLQLTPASQAFRRK